jgi:hypothetical protein
MLFSRIIPFEAYSEADVLRYGFLKTERSMVDEMAARGYGAAFAASQIDEDAVVYELPSWNTKLLLSNQEYDHPGSFLCLNPYQFEQGCEDKILLPRIFKALDSRQRVLLVQEALFGHDGEYENKIGKNPVQYYGEHLQAIQDHLAARGELDRTLIVVTSDHGLRDSETRTLRWSYRLPLLLINPRFSREVREGMYDQTDFAALLASEMAGTQPPPARTISLFVGPTNTSMLGSITADGDLLVVRDRRWSRYVLANGYCPGDEAPAERVRRAVSPAALLARFSALRTDFHPRLGDASPTTPPAAIK